MKNPAKMKYGYKELHIGMSRDEVIEIFGDPDSVSCRNGVETLGWETSEFKGFLRGGRTNRSVDVELENGKVVGFRGHNIDMTLL